MSSANNSNRDSAKVFYDIDIDGDQPTDAMNQVWSPWQVILNRREVNSRSTLKMLPFHTKPTNPY